MEAEHNMKHVFSTLFGLLLIPIVLTVGCAPQDAPESEAVSIQGCVTSGGGHRESEDGDVTMQGRIGKPSISIDIP